MNKSKFTNKYKIKFPKATEIQIENAYNKFSLLYNREIYNQNITLSLKEYQPHIYFGMLENIENKCFQLICQETFSDQIHKHSKGGF